MSGKFPAGARRVSTHWRNEYRAWIEAVDSLHDGGGNIALPVSSTIKIGGTTIVDSSGYVPAAQSPYTQTQRRVYTSFTEADSGCTSAAVDKVAWKKGTDTAWFAVAFCIFEKNSAFDKYVRFTCSLALTTAVTETAEARIYLDDENGHTVTSSALSHNSTTFTRKTQDVDISSLDLDRAITCEIQLRRTVGNTTVEMKRATLDVVRG